MIDFHSFENTNSYSNRPVDITWIEKLQTFIEKPQHKIAVDMGCGGGLYTEALADLGFKEIYGIDFSDAMLTSATNNYQYLKRTRFLKGTAYSSGLESSSIDFYLQRAVLHHLSDPEAAFMEAARILRNEGIIFIQDRTIEDCLIPGSTSHLRGYLYYDFPELIEIEKQRRPTISETIFQLKNAGFTEIKHMNLWEVRKKYDSFQDLRREIESRKGRSILHELTDAELKLWIQKLENRLPDMEIVEKDCWTIWVAHKKDSN
ncbi:class I SAM-dependent methyltransferase [Oceanobacillus sp. 1P07AA]|uniref:class I SAM-dependent methyltransferase n=1 Tax=Oceanobacillus sp. 1P07AA TaxID=3132293 RepID=UPI0039A645C7